MSSISSSSRVRNIDENADLTSSKPPIPTKSALRQSASEQLLPYTIPPFMQPPVHSRKNSYDTGRTAHPAYEWASVPVMVDGEDNVPVEGEKLAAFRRAGGYKRKPARTGSRWRTWLIIAAVVALIVIALIVGLAVGLTVGRRSSNNNGLDSSELSPADTDAGQPTFPIGQYRMITTLRTVDTSCTSNAQTWSCFPYKIYDPAKPDSIEGSRSTFDWIIANSSSTYATLGSGATSNEGEPANLTISSTSNPFSLTFNNTPLIYVSPSSNSSSARYSFSFDIDKAFNPPVSLSSSNGAMQCFYNQTTFTGTLYLSAPRIHTESNSLEDALQWPYAIDITQSSPGGADTPACYEYVQGKVGARITTGLTPQSADSQCLCSYRNY